MNFRFEHLLILFSTLCPWLVIAQIPSVNLPLLVRSGVAPRNVGTPFQDESSRVLSFVSPPRVNFERFSPAPNENDWRHQEQKSKPARYFHSKSSVPSSFNGRPDEDFSSHDKHHTFLSSPMWDDPTSHLQNSRGNKDLTFNPYIRQVPAKPSTKEFIPAESFHPSNSPSLIGQRDEDNTHKNKPESIFRDAKEFENEELRVQEGELTHFERVQVNTDHKNHPNDHDHLIYSDIDDPNAEFYEYGDPNGVYEYEDNPDYGQPFEYIEEDQADYQQPIVNESTTLPQPVISIEYSDLENKREEPIQDPTTEAPIITTLVNSKNLASLLADSKSVHLDSSSTQKQTTLSSGVTKEDVTRKPVSKTRDTVPEHIQFFQTESAIPEYYDTLYDEFMDTYYDDADYDVKFNDDTKKDVNNNDQPVTQPTTKTSTSTSTRRKESTTIVQVTEDDLEFDTTTPFITTPTPIIEETTTRASVLKITTRKPSTTVKIIRPSSSTTRSVRASRTISLSEILQELGLSLPEFLGTLKTHETSLKQFTSKLQNKSLSKSQFRKAKGNVKKLLEILDGVTTSITKGITSPPPPSTKTTTTPASTTTTKKSEPEERAKKQAIDVVPKVVSSTSTPINLQEEKPSQKPVIFGSQSSGTTFGISKSDKKETIDDNKPIKINMSVLSNGKDINPSDILQDFGQMFNISSVEETNVEVIEKTTKTSTTKQTSSLRPYRKETDRYRHYRPVDHNRGNPKIHRGIINHRLSSTVRPTLRPPYVPKPFPTATETPSEDNSSPTKPPIVITHQNKNSEDRNKYLKKNGSTSGSKEVSARSAIMAAAILGGVALTVFIAIFIVVRYRSHIQRHKRRVPMSIPSDSSSTSIPPIYGNRAMYSKECYQTSGFWTSLKRKFDPYSPSSSPMYM